MIFDFNPDVEHGVHITFHKNNILGWTEYLTDEQADEDLAK
jgi:hypothetical protein